MPSTQELLEQRANIWEQMKEIDEIATREHRDLSAEEQQKWDRADADLDALDDKISRKEKFENRSKDYSKVDRSDLSPENSGGKDTGTGDAYRKAFDSWMKLGSADMPQEERAILRTGFVDGKELKNAAGVGTGAAGGFTVPPEYRNVLIEHMKMVSSVRAVAQHISTDSGATLPWPTVDDTGNIGAILAENTQVSEQDVTFGTNSLDAFMYTSKLVRVSLQLINDTGFDLEGWLKRALGTRIARIQNQHFTTGTGTSQPDGLVTGATVGKQGAVGQTTSITYDDLVDLTDALDPAYLGGGNLEWMLSQLLRKSIRKIKDGQNRPLWEPSLQVGTPDTLLGYGTRLNNDLPAPAASAKSLLFGDFNEAYVVRDVNDLFLVRFAERYMDFLQVGFAAFMRTDGTVQNSFAYTAYQHSAT